MTFLEEIVAILPEYWNLSNLINLKPGWQANIADDEHVAIGTGATIEDALLSAATKANEGIYIGRLAHLERRLVETEETSAEGQSLLQKLGLGKPKQPFERRI